MICLLWGIGIIIGLYKIAAYSSTPDETAPAQRQWPSDTALTLASDRPTMLVTLHPRCACSRATLSELTSLLGRAPAPVQLQILQYRPKGVAEAWAQSGLTRQMHSIPGATVKADLDGIEAQRFGMPVSGNVAVYAPDGRLLFSGGITPARGHTGDSAGRAAILSILSKRQAARSSAPVFGCSIRDRK